MQLNSELLVETLESLKSKIVSRFHGRIALVSSRVDTDDVLQMVAIRAYKSLGKCQAQSTEEFEHWVLTIARNTVESLVTAHRSCAKRSSKMEEVAIGASKDEQGEGYIPAAKSLEPSEVVAMGEECERMVAALECIPPAQAKAVRMRYIEQAEYSEIGEAMGIAEGAVRNLVSRGLASLRKNMTETVAC